MLGNIITLLLTVAVVVIIAKYLFHLKVKDLVTIVINSVLGYIIIWALNYFNIVSIPLTILNSLIIGIFGIPGCILLVILVVFGII